ncbi:unnamed protein product, partial [Ectocarpus sp. 8 AP-2014]
SRRGVPADGGRGRGRGRRPHGSGPRHTTGKLRLDPGARAADNPAGHPPLGGQEEQGPRRRHRCCSSRNPLPREWRVFVPCLQCWRYGARR